MYIPRRAEDNAASIRTKAPEGKQSLIDETNAVTKGYTIFKAPSNLVFLSNHNKVLIVPIAQLKQLNIEN